MTSWLFSGKYVWGRLSKPVHQDMCPWEGWGAFDQVPNINHKGWNKINHNYGTYICSTIYVICQFWCYMFEKRSCNLQFKLSTKILQPRIPTPAFIIRKNFPSQNKTLPVPHREKPKTKTTAMQMIKIICTSS